MSRRATTAALLALLLGPAAAPAEDFRTVVPFVEGLRDRGYFDLADDYIEQVRRAPDLPADLKPVLAYELGRVRLAAAATTGDLERRRELLEQARGRLEAFAAEFPGHPLASEALVQLARLLVERGHLALIQADEAKTPTEIQARRSEARAAFNQARGAYDKAIARLKPEYDAFAKFLPEGDPRKAERDRVHLALMQAELQRAVVDYEDGQTYPADAAERKDLLARGLAAFEDLYKRYRGQEAGFYARMWQGKCFEERGDLGEAMGIYNELMTHEDPRLRPLQRQVGYFRILVMAKRGEHALAADEAVRWLQANPSQRRTTDGLGVQLELAKALLAQLPEIEGEQSKQAATRQATEALAEVVRVYSPHKAEALELLRKHRPKAALDLNAVANLSYEAASEEADEAINSEDWGRAAALLEHAVRKADPARDPDRANRARYLLAYVHYKAGRFYRAAVLAEHVARRYPQNGLAPRATEIGIQALLDAYNTITAGDRTTDLDRVVALAEYTAETWPDTEQGDFGHIVVGEVALGRGRYAEAAAAFEAVRPESGRRADALTRAGAAYWKKSLAAPDAASAGADADAEKARAALESALSIRRDAGATALDAGLLGNACDLAEVHLETGRPDEALKLLDPLAAEVGKAERPPALAAVYARLLSYRLRGHVASGAVDLALADMKDLEAAGGAGADGAQLYFQLGRLLKAEIDALEAKRDRAGVERLQDSYARFLAALVDTEAGQTFESLQWAGESLLAIDRPERAVAVFERVLKTFGDDESFKKRPNAETLLYRARLKRAAAYRGLKDFERAGREVQALMASHGRNVETRMEKAALAEARAEAGKASWDLPVAEWRTLATQLGGLKPRPDEYYEAWYHVAYGLGRQKKTTQAKQTLAAVMRLSPTVGTPELKARYEALLKRLGP